MKDESGRVLIRGWYDDVAPLSALEKRTIASLPPFDDSLRRELGFMLAEGGGRPLAELINQPSLNINGIVSAEAGEGARNVIPTVASVTLDLRLVKGNDYRRQMQRLVDHVKRQGFTVLDRAPTAALTATPNCTARHSGLASRAWWHRPQEGNRAEARSRYGRFDGRKLRANMARALSQEDLASRNARLRLG